MTNPDNSHEQHTDEWFRHTAEEGVPQHEHGAHASARALAITFIAMVLGVAFTIIVLVAYFNSYNSRFKMDVQETTSIGDEARSMRAEANGNLEQYRWIDHESVQVPIDEAMKAVVAERGNNPG